MKTLQMVEILEHAGRKVGRVSLNPPCPWERNVLSGALRITRPTFKQHDPTQ